MAMWMLLMPPMAPVPTAICPVSGMCALLTRRGYSMIMQISCRDKNRIAMQGDVLGASAMGVSNILCSNWRWRAVW